jgi:hypothetical protein
LGNCADDGLLLWESRENSRWGKSGCLYLFERFLDIHSINIYSQQCCIMYSSGQEDKLSTKQMEFTTVVQTIF